MPFIALREAAEAAGVDLRWKRSRLSSEF